MVNLGQPMRDSDADGRFNVLLTEDRPHPEEYWTRQLPRLLEPQGVTTYVAGSGREAIELAGHVRIHAAVIDMGTPMAAAGKPGKGASAGGSLGGCDSGPFAGEPAGGWIMELFRRLPDRPPLVVVHSPAVSDRQLARWLHDALRLGAFTVLNKPVELEQVLGVLRRLLDRLHAGHWPRTPGNPGPGSPKT